MNFASAQARKVTMEAQEKENARLTETAENIIKTIVEPELEIRALQGHNTAIIRYNECWSKVYEKVAEILRENGYAAACGVFLNVEW